MIRSKPKTVSEHQKIVKKVDKIIGDRVKERDGKRCVRCGSTKRLTAAHILAKGGRHNRLRFHEPNIITLCTGCHIFWWHRQGVAETYEWLEAKYPGRYEELLIASAMATKVDAKELLFFLERET